MSISENQKLGYKLSYNYLNPTVLNDVSSQSKYVLESLKHQFIAGINYNYKNFSTQIENRWLKRELNDAYFITDIRLAYQWNSLRIYSDITNLFNTQYKESGAVPMPSRWLSLGFKYIWQ